MSISIVGCRGLNQDTYAGCVQAVSDGKKSLSIDLRDVEFIDSFSVVELLCAMHQVDRMGAPITMQLPDGPLRGYLKGMRLLELMPGGVAFNGSRSSSVPSSDQLIPVSRLDMTAGEFGIERLSNFVYPLLDPEYAVPFTEAFAEIASNVIHHAEAKDAFISGQRLDLPNKGRNPPRLHLVVGDTGVGIRASLAQALPEVASMTEAEAVQLALQPGVTGKPGRNSGVGLYTVREYVEGFGGELRIRSGSWTVVWLERRAEVTSTPSLRGTVVAAELPTNRSPMEASA